MLNENIIAVGILVIPLVLAFLGLDDGDLAKMVVTAFLGWLVGKRTPQQEQVRRLKQTKK